MTEQALPTASTGSPEAKQEKSSYWLTQEEIEGLRKDSMTATDLYAAKHGYKVVRDKYGARLMK